MAVTVTDTSSAVFNWLKNGTKAAGIRALVYDEAIFESGDLSAADLEETFRSRLSASETGKILAVTVHDAGDTRNFGPILYEVVVIRLFDRQGGYRRIRAVKDLLVKMVDEQGEDGFSIADVDSQGRGLLSLRYSGRTGFRRSQDFAVDFEAITVLGMLLLNV